MPRQTDSPTMKLLRLSEEMSPEQLLDAIDILRHRYGQHKPKVTGPTAPKATKTARAKPRRGGNEGGAVGDTRVGGEGQ